LKLVDIILRTGRNPFKTTLILSIPFVAMFILLFLTVALLDERNHQTHLELQLKESARAYFRQILETRLWNALQKGVYVEVSEDVQPNPYLEDPERDMVSTGGKKYTKINPAYMTRLISDIANREGLYRFHLTSLRPINPSNAPDDWEMKMLRSFEEGVTEGYENTIFDGKEYFRYMAPLFVEEPCLRCHEKNGYRVGDIRGGLSVSIPTSVPYGLNSALRSQSRRNFLIIGIFSISMVVGIILVFSIRLSRGINRELEAERLRVAVELARAAAHELRQPMTIISGFSELMKDRHAKGENAIKETEIVIDQCYRMNEIITKMLNLSSYRTRYYDKNTEILDIHTETDTDSENKNSSS
jgi:hypothetical protein